MAGDAEAGADDLAKPNGCSVQTAEHQWRRLTEREWDLLLMLAGGFTGREAAAEFGLKTMSVSRALRRLKEKIGARNQAHVLVRAMELGFLVVIDGELQRNPETI